MMNKKQWGNLNDRVSKSRLTESMVRHCLVYKAVGGNWYLELADSEDDGRDKATTYGPFPDSAKAKEFVHKNFSSPGGVEVDDRGKDPVPTKSPNGKPVKPGK